jgi:exodeoxyribonuclease X
MDPEGKIPKYNLQYLRYFLGIKIEATAHDALGDILVLEKLFERLFVKMSKSIGPAAVENRMMDISSKPVLLARMYFGKHKGDRFMDIPVDYLKWLSGKDDLDEDLLFTVGHYLN